MALSTSPDALVLFLGIVLAGLYLFRDQVFSSSSKPKTTTLPVKEANGHGNPRDFVAKMKAGVRHFLLPISHVFIFRFRKSALLSSMVHKLGLLKNTLFVSPRKPSPSLVSLPSSATLKNMILKIWTKSPRTVQQYS